MKIPLLPFIALLTLFLFVGAFLAFGQAQSPLPADSQALHEQGKILGASEAREIDGISDMLFAGALPDNGLIGENYPVKKADYSEIKMTGCAGSIIDAGTSRMLFGNRDDERRPIASITKLATALVFLDLNSDWEKIYEIQADDIVSGGHIILYRGDKIKVKDLFFLSLVGSDNVAANALARSTGISREEFVGKMNRKMQELGLAKTEFVDPVGLGNGNVSTAFEVAKLAEIAFRNADIANATLNRQYNCSTIGGRKIRVASTDRLLNYFPQNDIQILGGKTGYTMAAGYCFVGKFSNKDGREIMSVILGNESTKGRFEETSRLVEWAYKNFVWQ